MTDHGDLVSRMTWSVFKMKEKRPVLKRSVWILQTKKSVLQTEHGDLLKQRKFKHVHLKTARVSMLCRLMIEHGDLFKTQLQYKTTLKYIMKPKRATLTMKHFVKEWRRIWISEFQDYHIPLWSTRKVPSFEKWFRKLRTTQIDILQQDLRQNQSNDWKRSIRRCLSTTDALADENHTHYLTPQYFYYKSNWWLRSNKTGSDIVPVQRRPDFKKSIVYYEDHTHHATEEELNVYRSNWWIGSNFVGSATMPIRHRADFKKALSTFVTSRMKRIKLITKIGGKALPRLCGIGKILGGIPHLRHHRDDGPNTDRLGKLAKNSDCADYSWNESQN